MSSPADPSSPEPASDPSTLAEQVAGGQAAQPASDVPTEQPVAVASNSPTEADAPSERRGSRIPIGTQRYGTKAPKAVPRPVLPMPPASTLNPAGASEAPAHAESSEAELADEPAAGVTPDAPAPAPSRGSGPRRSKHAPRKPERPLNEQAPRTYPPPNIRGQLTPDLEMEYLEALGDQSLDEIIAGESAAAAVDLEPESRHQGKVVAVHRDDVFVEIDGLHQGILSLRSLPEPPEPGKTVDVVVNRFNAVDGIYELTLPGAAVDVGDWSEVAEGMVVEARVTGHNKGGLECEVNHLRGFIPASQISMYRVEDLAQFVGQSLNCIIAEANPEKRNLVLSHRAVLERERAEAKEKLLAELEAGQVREGTVRSLQGFGAFVDLGGVDGLVHISQISWDRIKHPSEVLEIGQKVKVKIHKIDPDTGKISLALRDLTESPWATAARDFPTRGRVTGRVTRLTDFGAFVRLGPGVEGLIHISELSHKRVFRVSDVLSEGQEVEVLVLSVDPEAQRISLSLKALEAKPVSEKEKAEPEPDEPETPPAPAKKRSVPLRGGIGGPPTGDKFGLKW